MSDVQRVLIEVSPEGVVTAFPDPVSVRGSDVLLAFRIKTADWIFPETGAIVVPNGGAAFPYAAWTVNPQLAVLVDANPAPGAYDYFVTVQHVTTGQRIRVDPTIRNEN